MKKEIDIKKLKDNEIDYSDIPKTDKDFWADAVVIEPTNKVLLTVRYDTDVIDFFKQQ